VLAEEHLLRCIEIDPCYVPGLRDYAEFLEQSGRSVRDFRVHVSLFLTFCLKGFGR
jgi:hypothetical protein